MGVCENFQALETFKQSCLIILQGVWWWGSRGGISLALTESQWKQLCTNDRTPVLWVSGYRQGPVEVMKPRVSERLWVQRHVGKMYTS